MKSPDLSHQYDAIADAFAAKIEEGNKASRNAFRAMLPSLKGKSVLDLGCGEGTDTFFYKQQGAAVVVGLDASKELLAKAQAKYPDIEFIYGLFEKLSFADEKFDYIFSKYALMTSPEMQPIFEGVYRVLKPGGIFMFLVTHPIRQLYEKKKAGRDYFVKEIVSSVCFDGAITFKEPSHTLKEYFSDYILKNFILEGYDEQFDPAAEKINDTYPGILLLKWVKKSTRPVDYVTTQA